MAQWIEPAVTYEFEVALDDDPWATSPAYTSLGSRVRWVSSFRGSQSPLMDDTAPSPGSCDVLLDNRDMFLDPTYTAGPYYGKLLPMKRARLTIIVSAVTLTVLTGWVMGWPQDWDTAGDGTARVTFVEGTPANANAALPPSAYSDEVSNDAATNYWPFQGGDLTNRVAGGVDLKLDSSTSFTASVAADSMGGPVGEDQGIYIPGVAGGIYGISPFAVIPAALDLWVYCNPAVSLNIWNLVAGTSSTNFWKIYSLDNTGFLLTYSHAADNLKVVGASVTNVGMTGLHHIAAYRSGSNIVVMIDGSIAKTIALGAGTDASGGPFITLAPSGANTQTPTIGHLAFYDTAPSEARFNAHYNVGKWAWSGAHGDFGWETSGARITRALDDIGWPSNLRSISTGATLQGPYLPRSQRALDYIRQVVASEQGRFYFDGAGNAVFRDHQWVLTQADAHDPVFSDDGANVRMTTGSPDANMLDTVRNVITASWKSGAITRRDTSSISHYREAPETIDSPTINDAQDASNLAAFRVREDGSPKSTISVLRINMRKNIAAYFAAIQPLDINDVVTVERTPNGVGSQRRFRHQLLGIGHDFSPDQWWVNLYLGPATRMFDEVPYLTIGDAAYGIIGAFDPLLDETGAGITDETGTVIYVAGTGQLIPF